MRTSPAQANLSCVHPGPARSSIESLGTLSTDKGATLDELTRATGWLPHTARAALTGLRKRGYDVRLVRGGGETASVYRLTTVPAGGAR